MTNAVWVVVQQGVYQHGTFGPFADESLAREFADRQAADPDEDGYHSYEVRQMDRWGLLGVVYSVQKKDRKRHLLFGRSDAVARGEGDRP